MACKRECPYPCTHSLVCSVSMDGPSVPIVRPRPGTRANGARSSEGRRARSAAVRLVSSVSVPTPRPAWVRASRTVC